MPEPLYIVGPTGSGKSAVALELAHRIDGEIVNADAFQIYREIPIITAAPTEADQQKIPHHLYRCLSVSEPFSVAHYQRLATEVIKGIQARGHTPIIVGGSGLYVKTLTHGLSETPPSSETLRNSLQILPLHHLVTWLETLDPKGAANMNLKNPRYVQRALEITLLAGRPASDFKTAWQKPPSRPVQGIFLQWDRQTLYDRINQRVLTMIQTGALQEAAALTSLSSTAAKAIGITELKQHLAGHLTLTEATQAIQQATRRYAKRQDTWFRREKHFTPLPVDTNAPPPSIVQRILNQLRQPTTPSRERQ